MAQLPKSARLMGDARDKLTKKMITMYNRKMSIRAISESTGRSYGAVHKMLSDAGVVFRGRGGAVRKGSNK